MWKQTHFVVPGVRMRCALPFLSVFLPLCAGQFFVLPLGRQAVGAAGGVSPFARQSTCPQIARKGLIECAGQLSTCWSPGVRDLDCPSSGLCCFNGCVNVCEGPPPKSPEPQADSPPKVFVDPCHPSPCGPGTSCSPSPNGHPICRCREGLVPKPDTITGCGPECVNDAECKQGLVCLNQRCVDKPDPCNPSPCGPGAFCTVNSVGNPICRCEAGLIPKPDTITGCGPECTRDPDCSQGLVCLNQRCAEKPDPCSPSPCGPGATCMTNSVGNPICRCQPGLIPKPDTITGCGPECVRDADCRDGLVCQNQHCVARPDPCNPSPCGPGAICSVNSVGNPICRCTEGLVPKPDTITGCGPECVRDPDCKQGFVCLNQVCAEKPDPCVPSPCGPGAQCTLNKAGNPICRCEEGLIPKPDTITGCGPECLHDHDCSTGHVCLNQHCTPKPDPCNPSPCGPGATCMMNSAGNPICRCEPGLIPKPDTITGCGPECLVDLDCRSGFICSEQRCVEKPDPCNPSPCGPGTMCMSNQFGNAVCRCLEGLIPMPDTISGCKPECEVDEDCSTGFLCQSQKCIEKPDPCIPNPCGPNAICSPQGTDGFSCSCPPGFLGDAKVNCVQGECQVDADCPLDKACDNFYCINPCQVDTCKKTDFCKVIQHIPTCGFNFMPIEHEPMERFVIGESYKPGSNEIVTSERRSSSVIGGQYQKIDERAKARNVVVIGSSHDHLSVVGKRRKRHLAEQLMPHVKLLHFF